GIRLAKIAAIRRRRIRIERHGTCVRTADAWRHIHNTGLTDAGDGGQRRGNLFEYDPLRLGRAELVAGQVETRMEQTGCVETGIDPRLSARAFDEHAGAAEEHQR